MDVTVADPTVIAVALDAEAILAGIDLSATADTNDAPEAAAYDALRALPPDALAERFEAAFPAFAGALLLEGLGAPALRSVEVAAEPDPELPRDTRVVMEAPLEAPAPSIGFPETYGELILRQRDEDAFAGLLAPGELSPPLAAAAAETPGRTFLRHVVAGFEQVVPEGLDHALFVLGLLFHSLALAPLLWQVAAFTLAHTATLALATLGLVSVPASVVEPAIALTVVYVGVENVLRPPGEGVAPWRPAVVLVFGALHGLGLAAAFADMGGGTSNLLARLLGFGLGVELALLAVLAAAFLLLGLPFGRRPWWRRAVAVPASLAVAAGGLILAAERTGLA